MAAKNPVDIVKEITDLKEEVPQGFVRAPYRFTQAKREVYLDLLRRGGRRHKAARAVGIDPQTAAIHMQKDAAFRGAVELAEMEADEAVENTLYATAVGGNIQAIQMWLYNRRPERWGKRGQVSLDFSSDIVIDLGAGEEDGN